MAEIREFINPKIEPLNKEFQESLDRADEYAAEYAEILAKLEIYEKNGVQPHQALIDRIIELMGLRSRENRIQKELLRAMGKTPIQDMVDEKKNNPGSVVGSLWAISFRIRKSGDSKIASPFSHIHDFANISA